jgi:N-acetylneuraminic acid mutarotase
MDLSRRTLLGAAPMTFATGAEGEAPGFRRGRLHVRRYAPALASAGDRVFLTGGAPIGKHVGEGHFYSGMLTLVEEIGPDLGQQFVANALYPRANHISVVLDGQIWVLGGRTQHGGEATDVRWLQETERFDMTTQAVWRGPDLPRPRMHLAGAVHGRNLYIFGGSEVRSSSAFARTNYVLKPPYTEWRSIAPAPIGLANATATVIGDRIFLIGGFDGQASHAVTNVYDIATDAWTTAAPPHGLSAHAAASVGHSIVTFGDYTHQAATLAFDTRTGVWRRTRIPFVPRRHVRACRAWNGVVVAGGNQSSEAPAVDAIEFYPDDMLVA